MSAIGPIQGPSQPPAATGGLSASRGRQDSPGIRDGSGGADFPSLKDLVDGADAGQQRSGQAIQDLVSGRSRDIVGVITQVADADLSFKLLIGVRNQIIEAYKQTMNMQI